MTEEGHSAVALDFGIHKSLRYHAKRRTFFETLHRIVMIIASVGGSAAFIALLQPQAEVAKWVALGIAIAATLDVMADFSGSARKHYDLYQRFADLAAEVSGESDPTDEHVRSWKVQRLLIEKEESAPLAALNVMCHNEEAEARDYGAEALFKVRWYQKLFSQLLTLPPNQFPRLIPSG